MNRGLWITVALSALSVVACTFVSTYLGVIRAATIIVLMIGFVVIAISAPHVFSVERLSLVSVLAHSQLALLVLPSLWLVNSIRSEFAARATVGAVLSLFLVGLGGLVASLGMPPRRSSTWDWAQLIGISVKSRSNWTVYAVILGMSIITITYYVRVTPFIPLISMIHNFGSPINLLGMREVSFKLLRIPPLARYLVEWTRSIFWPLLTSITLCEWTITRQRKQLLIVIVLILTGIVVVGATTEKGLVARFCISTVLAYMLMRGRRFRLRIGVFGVLAGLIFPFIVYLFNALSVKSSSPFLYAWSSLWKRLFMVPARIAMVHYAVFPREVEFLHGASMNVIAQLRGRGLFPLTNFLYVHFYPWGIADNPSGYANAAFSSEMWANFGWLGVIMASFALGWLLQYVNFWIWRLEKTPMTVAVYSVMLLGVFVLISTNITVFLITKGFIILCLMAWITGLRKTPLMISAPPRGAKEGRKCGQL